MTNDHNVQLIILKESQSVIMEVVWWT